MKNKIVIYQMLPRLFGNEMHENIPNGSMEQNGVGKFSYVNDAALRSIRRLGATHVWYTGVIEHATKTDFSAYGIRPDHHGMIKGCAGSPYAIKDYYDVNPSLARNVAKRNDEFEALLRRTKRLGLRSIIDFVPNHVAREYLSDNQPEGVEALGEKDNVSLAFDPQNNFYYIPGEALQPQFDHSMQGVPYHEEPAKATGNDQFHARPSKDDWYETVKLNYGVDYAQGRTAFDPVPGTWGKMRDILLFWAAKGVDGFRCDMAEMVPVEFWAWAIPQVKMAAPEIIFIAEIYQPHRYVDYIVRGGFDYLYDKVGLYDTLRGVICGTTPASQITQCWQQVDGYGDRMLNFLENHDEQRIASDMFAVDPMKAIPGMIVCAMISTCPVMLYSGQELGERGMDLEGYSGVDGRTTIFDYWSVDTLARWCDKRKYSLEKLTDSERALRECYSHLLKLCNSLEAVAQGEFYDITYANLDNPRYNAARCFSFLRHNDDEVLLIVVNFDGEAANVGVKIPLHAFEMTGISHRGELMVSCLYNKDGQFPIELIPDAPIALSIPAYSARIISLGSIK